MNHLSLQLNDRHSGMLMGVKFDEGKSTVGLHADFRKIANGLEKRDKVRLGAVGNQVSNINRRIVCGCLLDDGFVR